MIHLFDRIKVLNLLAAKDNKDELESNNGTIAYSLFNIDTDTNNSHDSAHDSDNQDFTNGISSNSSNNSSIIVNTTRENPLQYPEILEHFFQLCPVSILASCRLVCKLWYEESLLPWRSSAPIAININNDNTNIFIGPRQHTILQEFVNFTTEPVNQYHMKPFRNFVIQQEERLENRKLIFKVLEDNMGGVLSSLTLSQCNFSNVYDFRRVIYQCCPILQKLVIDRCIIISDIGNNNGVENWLHYMANIININNNSLEDWQRYGENRHLKSLYICHSKRGLPVSWLELLSHYTSLTSLEYRIWNEFEFPQWEFINLMHAIREIRKNDVSSLPFKYFHLHPYLTISRKLDFFHKFDDIKELQLPLKSCIVEVYPNMDTDFVTTTLQILASSVNTIILDLDKHVKNRGDTIFIPELSQDFPLGVQLDNLTKLESRGDLIGSFEFLKFTPNLCTLDISNGDEENDMDTEVKSRSYTMAIFNTCEDKLTHLQMEHLTTLKLGFRVNIGDIILLYKWMPYIQNLHMVLDEDQFGMVCRKWRNMREMTVFGDSHEQLLTEDNVTGINKKNIIRPDIVNLEGLESLVLKFIKLTPESFYYLFLQLPNLRIIHHQCCDTVKRQELDIYSYQLAVIRCSYYATNTASMPLPKLLYNVVKQWITENSDKV